MVGRLASALAAQPHDHPLAQRLCDASREVLQMDGVALTLDGVTRGRLTVCTSDAASADLEDLHEVLGEGPGIDALSGAAVLADLDARADLRWPAFAPAARERTSAVSVLALPLHPGPESLGVLVAYRRSLGVLPMTLPEAVVLSTTVGAALRADESGSADSAAESWPDRAAVHQATGMVMAQLRLSSDDALAILRAHAFADDHTLVHVASDVVTRALVFVPGEDAVGLVVDEDPPDVGAEGEGPPDQEGYDR